MSKLIAWTIVAALFVGQTGVGLAAPLAVTTSDGGSDFRQSADTETPEPTPTTTAALSQEEAAAAPDSPGGENTPEATPEAAADNQALDVAYGAELSGTIVANRTESEVRFFVEGQTYEIDPLRSVGIGVPRGTAVLNLFNCDARKAEATAGCFWDPYLLTQDGFYEVITGEEAGKNVTLFLQEAGAPPTDQIWIQNRSGNRETIIIDGEPFEIPPSSVQTISGQAGVPLVVHLRNCIIEDEQPICEWAPHTVEPGYYYGLVTVNTLANADTQISRNELEGIVASTGQTIERPPQATCVLRVPALNVRGGPGLEYPIIAKIRTTDEDPANFVVVGFDGSKQWLEVSKQIAQEGWVTANPDFIACSGDLASLPVAVDLASVLPTPTAVPLVVEEPVVEQPPVVEEPVAAPVAPAEAVLEVEAPAVEAAPAVEENVEVAEQPPIEGEVPPEEATEEATALPTIPAGLARLVVNNGFDQIMRFTLDQKYRVERNNLSGEWDLQPGDAIAILVYPGDIAFSASTPWNGGLADNAVFFLDQNEERVLWLYFIPDPDGSGEWILQY